MDPAVLAAAAPKSLQCNGCCESFPSRNALFRHLQEHGCGGGARRRTERSLLLYGYVGASFHGSQMNAKEDEARCPTVEGALLAGLEAAALAQRDAIASTATVRSRASRTDRGVHALSSAICVQTTTEFRSVPRESPAATAITDVVDEEQWLNTLQKQLPPELWVLRRYQVLDPEFNARFACQKREYWYFVPYDAILLPEERHISFPSGCDRANAEKLLQDDQCGNVLWMMGLPDEFDATALRRRVLELLSESGFQHNIVTLAARPDAPGSATITFADCSAVLDACSVLDGAIGLLDPNVHDVRLLALPETVARIWRSAHTRLRASLKRLTGTRSFHNFSPGFSDATDPKSIRSVYRCRAGITSGFHDFVNGSAFAVLRITGRDFLYRQIRGMAGLVVACARGVLPDVYVDLALSDQPNIEVPCAPAGHLVLSECVFRDGAFAAPWAQAAGSKSLPDPDVLMRFRSRVVEELCREGHRHEFADFVQDLEKMEGALAVSLATLMKSKCDT